MKIIAIVLWKSSLISCLMGFLRRYVGVADPGDHNEAGWPWLNQNEIIAGMKPYTYIYIYEIYLYSFWDETKPTKIHEGSHHVTFLKSLSPNASAARNACSNGKYALAYALYHRGGFLLVNFWFQKNIEPT